MVHFVGQEASPLANFMFHGYLWRIDVCRAENLTQDFEKFVNEYGDKQQEATRAAKRMSLLCFPRSFPRPTQKPFVNSMWMKAQDSVRMD